MISLNTWLSPKDISIIWIVRSGNISPRGVSLNTEAVMASAIPVEELISQTPRLLVITEKHIKPTRIITTLESHLDPLTSLLKPFSL